MQLQEKIYDALRELGAEIENPKKNILSIPDDITHGDYTTNVAFTVAKSLKKSPLQIAEELVEKLQQTTGTMFSNIEAVKPGFINFYFSHKTLIAGMKEIIDNPALVGRTTVLQDKKIMVEFTDPNPFKEFHIGHLYSNTVGESICRILEAQGAEVKRACYQGDVGLHVAKALWGMLQLSGKMPKDETSLQEQAQFLGKAYALGATAFEEDPNATQQIKELNKKIYQEDASIITLYNKGREWSMQYFDSIYLRLGMQFDYFYPESKAGSIGLSLVKQHIQDGVFEEDQGAVVFRGEKYGLHTRVFVNSLGLPTYEAKELGLAPTKYQDFPYDLSLIITANEIDEYFKVLLQVLKLINPTLGAKTRHMSHGLVKLPEGKMSSRTGKIVSGEWLLDEAHKRSAEKILEAKHTDTKVPTPEQDSVAELVGVGAVKYAFLKNTIGKDMEFSFDDSISFEGNAGPYLQYSFVRTHSILEKAPKDTVIPQDYKPNLDEIVLLRRLIQFESVVLQAGELFAPSIIAGYIYELAKQFSVFYQNNRIVDAKEEDQVAFRVKLTDAVGMVLERGLHLLGIEAPKHM